MGREHGQDWRQELASALDWWRDAGVDTLVDDEPRDWLARTAPRAEAPDVETPPVAEAPLPDTLEAFLAWRMADAAPEAGWLSPLVGPSGPAGAEWMVLTDMPEPGDGETGILLGGAPGRLLDRILASIGVARDSVHIAPLAFARPLTGQIPGDEERRLIELARHHIALAAPRRLLLLGQAANRVRTTTNGSASGNGEEVINHFGRNKEHAVEVVAIRHPRFLLEQPAAKAEAWDRLIQFSGGICP
jgi:DNA polymerase